MIYLVELSSVVFDIQGAYSFEQLELDPDLATYGHFEEVYQSLYMQFCAGLISEADFFQELAQQPNVNRSAQQLGMAWKEFRMKPNHRILSRLKEIPSNRLVGLLNLDPLRAAHIAPQLSEWLPNMSKVFRTDELGSALPETGTFYEILSQSQLFAEDVVYLDSNDRRVLLSRQVGVRGLFVKEPHHFDLFLKT